MEVFGFEVVVPYEGWVGMCWYNRRRHPFLGRLCHPLWSQGVGGLGVVEAVVLRLIFYGFLARIASIFASLCSPEFWGLC